MMLLQSSCRDNAESQTTQQDVVHMFLNAYFIYVYLERESFGLHEQQIPCCSSHCGH